MTWLLAVRNGMPYLPETLASIEAQTYRNWEVLVWDNGSTDGTVEELHRWIPHRLPGRVVTDTPLPLALSRARLMEEAPTEFCAWIDADDVNEPGRLEEQVDFLIEHPEVAVVGTQLIEVDEAGSLRSETWIGRLPLDDDEIVRDMLRTPGIAQPSVLLRRSAILAAGNYRYVEPVNVAEDYDLWLRVAARHKVANLDMPLLRYRVHDAGTTITALRQGLLDQATFDRFVEHAPALFGCSSEEARQLVTRTHPLAILPLVRIAQQLKRRSGVSVMSTLRSDRFQLAAHMFIGARHLGDAVSHLALKAFDRAPGAFRREVGILFRGALGKLLPGVSSSHREPPQPRTGDSPGSEPVRAGGREGEA